MAGLPVHPDPIPIFYEFAGVLAFIKINDGWNLHHGAGNSGTGVDFGKHPASGRCPGHERRSEIAGPTIGTLATRQHQDFLFDGFALVDVAMLPDDACFRIYSCPSGLSFNWDLHFNDYNFPNISLDITIFSTSLVPS